MDKALEEKVYRANLIDERIQELFTEGTLMVDVSGSVVAQVNGLSVYDIGDFSFGKPSRITSRVYLGKAGVIDIEREAKLSGRIYNKGVLILSGYLGGTYAQDKTLSVSATLAFEQSYGEVEGDSASAAELIALISGIAEAPRQAEPRHHRLDQPEGRDPAHRRGERKDRRILCRVQEPRTYGRPGRDHPGAE